MNRIGWVDEWKEELTSCASFSSSFFSSSLDRHQRKNRHYLFFFVWPMLFYDLHLILCDRPPFRLLLYSQYLIYLYFPFYIDPKWVDLDH